MIGTVGCIKQTVPYHNRTKPILHCVIGPALRNFGPNCLGFILVYRIFSHVPVDLSVSELARVIDLVHSTLIHNI